MTLFDPGRIFETLDRHCVDYLTIGAWAVVAHGYVRATADIDFMARRIEQKTSRLQTLPATSYELERSGGQGWVVRRAGASWWPAMSAANQSVCPRP